ncbi:MAG: alanine racemase, partial [Oscillospiraceae bacterium]
MYEYLKRTWVEINLDNIDYNINSIKNKLSSKTKIMAVVKADAYSHGYKQIVKKLNQCNIDFFAVSNLAEAMEIRKISTSDILILGYTQPDKATVLANNNITQAVFSYEYAKKLDLYAKAENCFVKAHYKIDTGM